METVTLEISVDIFSKATGGDVADIMKALSVIGREAAKNNSSVWNSAPKGMDLISAIRYNIKTATKDA